MPQPARTRPWKSRRTSFAIDPAEPLVADLRAEDEEVQALPRPALRALALIPSAGQAVVGARPPTGCSSSTIDDDPHAVDISRVLRLVRTDRNRALATMRRAAQPAGEFDDHARRVARCSRSPRRPSSVHQIDDERRQRQRSRHRAAAPVVTRGPSGPRKPARSPTTWRTGVNRGDRSPIDSATRDRQQPAPFRVVAQNAEYVYCQPQRARPLIASRTRALVATHFAHAAGGVGG